MAPNILGTVNPGHQVLVIQELGVELHPSCEDRVYIHTLSNFSCLKTCNNLVLTLLTYFELPQLSKAPSIHHGLHKHDPDSHIHQTKPEAHARRILQALVNRPCTNCSSVGGKARCPHLPARAQRGYYRSFDQ